MLISFFEEFPTKNNLEKIKLITWPTKLYLAAKSLEEFNRIKTKIKNKNIKEFIYWPILEQKEGYWISPFAKRSALKRILNELKNVKIPVMLDLELPTTQNPLLYITQLPHFLRNKSLIKQFIIDYPGEVYLAEYYPVAKSREKLLGFLGLHYKNHHSDYAPKIIKMAYHSMHHFNQDFITNELNRGKKEFSDNFLIAYGIIAKGIGGREPLLSLTQLKEDLRIAKETGIKEAVIFRLGGLNKEYVKLIKNFI